MTDFTAERRDQLEPEQSGQEKKRDAGPTGGDTQGHFAATRMPPVHTEFDELPGLSPEMEAWLVRNAELGIREGVIDSSLIRDSQGNSSAEGDLTKAPARLGIHDGGFDPSRIRDHMRQFLPSEYRFSPDGPPGTTPVSREGYVYFDGQILSIRDRFGSVVKQWSGIVSGKPGTTPDQQLVKDTGPLPEGVYTLDPQKIDHYRWYEPTDYDWASLGPLGQDNRRKWGTVRVPADPTSLTTPSDRNGFFIHGGWKPGSAGCIDVHELDEEFFADFEEFFGTGKSARPVLLVVDYKEWRKRLAESEEK